MHRHALPGSYQRSPVAVNFSQRGLILNALVQLGNRFLIGGKMMKRVQRVFGSLLFGTTVFGSSALREVGGFLLDRLLLFFLFFHALVEAVVCVGENWNLVERVLPSPFEQVAFFMQCQPGTDLGSKVVCLVLGIRARDPVGGNRVRMRSGLVLL